MALDEFGYKLAVGAVGVGDEPIIHLPYAQNLIHNDLWITLLQLALLGKEVGAAYFKRVGSRHIKNDLVSAKVAKPLYARKDGVIMLND